MKLLIYYFGFNFIGVLAYFSYPYRKISSKEKFPFKNYYFVSTRVSKFPENTLRIKRGTVFDDCLNLTFSNNNYKMCITQYNISDNGIINKNTQFIVCNQNSTNTYTLNQFKIKFVKGYIATKPYTSAFNGYISNNNLYGKMEVDSKMFYIDPLDNFPSLASNEVTENAIVYEIPLNNTNIPKLQLKTNVQYSKSPFSFRKKRNTKTVVGRLCSLMVIIDNSFLRIIGRNNIKSAITTVLHSLDLANALFRITDFDNDDTPDNIGFTIKYVIVLESENTGMNKLPLYTKHPMDGKLFLFFLSQYELLGEVCLGVGFTAQSFMHRVLGLSYTGITEDYIYSVPSNNTGGICERPSNKEGDGSFNNLVITYRLEHDEAVPQITSDLALVHELGHSFGSDHDKEPECLGYLMAPHTFNHTYGHNFLFSNCSKKQIDDVVKYRGSCLQISADPFCGNGLVEGDEDCDCGLTMTCVQKDHCCVARNSQSSPCTVNKNAGFECHPSQGLCCMPNCRLRNISNLGLNCENFSKKCPCNNSNELCSCGIEGGCIEEECHSAECTRIKMRECKCSSYRRLEQSCCTCCLGSNGICLPSKVLTKEFATKSEINIDQLSPYAVQTKAFLNTNAENYEEYCIDSKCITLLFRTFKEGGFCLFKGELGMCQSDYTCNTNTAVWSRLPESSAVLVKMNSAEVLRRQFLLYYCFGILLVSFICCRY